MVWAAAFMLAVTAGARCFSEMPWIGMFWGTVSLLVFSFFIAEKKGSYLPLAAGYYGLALTLFPEHRQVFLISPLLAIGYATIMGDFVFELVGEGFSLARLTRTLSAPVVVCNYLFFLPAFKNLTEKLKTIISALVCAGCAVYLLEMIAK